MLVRVKRAEDDLEESRDELRALAAELQSAREEERTAIAREIHDELGQTLTSLQLGLAWIAAKVAASRQRPLQAKVTALAALVTSLIRSVRTIAEALRPGVLDELGLVGALRSEAREFKRHTGIPRSLRRRRCVSDRPGGAHECGPARTGLAGQRCSREGKKRLDPDGPRQREGGPREGLLQSWRPRNRGDAGAHPCTGRDVDRRRIPRERDDTEGANSALPGLGWYRALIGRAGRCRAAHSRWRSSAGGLRLLSLGGPEPRASSRRPRVVSRATAAAGKRLGDLSSHGLGVGGQRQHAAVAEAACRTAPTPSRT
jgi:hypothetical protein